MIKVKVEREGGLLAKVKKALKGDLPKPSSSTGQIEEKAVRVVALTFFLLPFFFWPLTPEFYETAKLALLALAVFLLSLFYISLSLKERACVFPPTPLFPALLFLLLSVVLGTFFSVSTTDSLLGRFSSPHGGLISYLLYFSLFVFTGVFVTTPARIRKILTFWVIGSSILAFLTILQYFQVYLLPMAYARQRFWMPSGGLTFTAVYLALAVFLITYLLKVTEGGRRRLALAALGLHLLALALLGLFLAWVLLAAGGLVLVWVLGREVFSADFRAVKVAALAAAVAAVLGTPSVRQALLPGDLAALPTEIILGRSGSWAVTAQILTTRPLLGTGPETFDLVYPQIKSQIPVPFTNINLNFPRAGVEVMQFVAGMGLVGFAALFFLLAALFLTIKNRNRNRLTAASDASSKVLPAYDRAGPAVFLAAASAAALTSWFLAPAGVVTSTALFALLGLTAAARTDGSRLFLAWPDVVIKSGQRTREKYPLSSGVAAAAQVAGLGVVVVLLGRYLLGDFHYNQAITAFRAGDGNRALQAVGRAIRINPSRDEYSVGAATVNLALASNLSRQPEATDAASQTSQLINSFVNEAVNQARRAAVLNPQRVANWQNLGDVYRNLTAVMPGAAANAVGAYRQAIQLDPANPFLSISLGNVLLQSNQPRSAAAAFRNAILIRPNLPAAHLGLARSLRLSGDLENAVKSYERLLTFKLDQKSDIYKTIKQEYEQTKKALADKKAGAKSGTGEESGAASGQAASSQGQGTAPVAPDVLGAPGSAGAAPSPSISAAPSLVPETVAPVQPTTSGQ
jgi:cytochrome c-type biogenesis protein CcmH/NrfG/O-antigen ligase